VDPSHAAALHNLLYVRQRQRRITETIEPICHVLCDVLCVRVCVCVCVCVSPVSGN
jgi:hypothetical protein